MYLLKVLSFLVVAGAKEVRDRLLAGLARRAAARAVKLVLGPGPDNGSPLPPGTPVQFFLL